MTTGRDLLRGAGGSDLGAAAVADLFERVLAGQAVEGSRAGMTPFVAAWVVGAVLASGGAR